MADTGELASFYARLGFLFDPKGLDSFTGGLNHLKQFMGGFSGTALGMLGDVGLMVENVIQTMSDVDAFATTVGQSASEIFAVGKAAAIANVSLEGFESTVQGLSYMIGQAASGVGRGAKILGQFGIAAKDSEGHTRSLQDVLVDVADKMKGKSRSERVSMAQRLGIDAHMIELLEKGGDAFDAFYKKAKDDAALADEDFHLANAAQKDLNKLKGAFGKILMQLAAIVLPLLVPILDSFVWLTKAIISTVNWLLAPLKALVSIVAASFRALSDRVGKTTDSFKKWAVGSALVKTAGLVLKTILSVVTVALSAFFAAVALRKGWTLLASGISGAISGFRALAVAMLANPIMLIVAAIAFLGLVFEDLWAYFHGGISVIGGLIDLFPWLKSYIDGIKPAVQAIGEAFVWIWERQARPALEGLMVVLQQVWEAAVYLTGLTAEVFSGLWNEILLPIIQMFASAWAAVFGEGGDATTQTITFGDAVKGVFLAIGLLINGTIAAIRILVTALKDAWTWAQDVSDSVTGLHDTSTQKTAKAIAKAAATAGGAVAAQGQQASLNNIAANVGLGPALFGTSPPVADAMGQGKTKPPLPGALGGAHTVTTKNNTVNIGTVKIETPDPTKAGQAITNLKVPAKNAQGPVQG